MTTTAFLLLAVFLLAFIADHASAFTVELRAAEKQCYHEQMLGGDQMIVGFQVMESAEHAVDFWLTNPQGMVETNQVKTAGYEHTVVAKQPGRYTYCFENKHAASGHPSSQLSFYVYHDSKDAVDKEKELLTDPLEKELLRLKEGLRSISEEQQYIVMRERQHRDTSESTNARVLWWSVLQMAVVGGTCWFQVWFVKQFFEVRRAF